MEESTCEVYQGIKGVWRLVVSYKESQLADLKHQKKKLNLCVRHVPEALESSFAGFLQITLHPITDTVLHS